MTDIFVGDNDHGTDKDHLYWKGQYELERQQNALLKEERDEARRLYCIAILEAHPEIYRRVAKQSVKVVLPEEIAQMKGWDCYE